MNNSTTLIIAGDGWGAVSAAKSLIKYFTNIYVLSNDKVVFELFPIGKRIKKFESVKYDYVICAGYKPFIRKQLTDTGRFINIHYSLLPKYRGLHSTAWAIMNGEKTLGLTIHLMNEYMDDGPIIHQQAFENDNASTAAFFMELMNKYIEDNLSDIILKYINGSIIPFEQNMAKASWVGKRGNRHNFINFNKDIEYIKRLFRVLSPPYPFPQISYKGELFFIKKVSFHQSEIQTDIGRILNIDYEGVWVKVKDGYVILQEIYSMNNKLVDYSLFKIGNYVNDKSYKI